MLKLAIIIVAWNTRDLLRRCVETVHASLAGAGIGYQIVVVDNASADGTAAMLRAEHPEVVLLEAGRNLGFAGGNNLALRRVLGAGSWGPGEVAPNPSSHQPPEYILLLNPDTEVVGDAIARLVRYLEAHPDVALVGPRLRYPDGSVQPSRRRFPTAGVYFWESTPLEQRWPNNPVARRYRYAEAPDDVEQEADWLVGAALLARRSAVERAGLLDAGFHMYSEELEWQRRIRGRRLERRDDTFQLTTKARRHEDLSHILSFFVPSCLRGKRANGSYIKDIRVRDRLGEAPASSLQPPTSRIVYLPSAEIVHHEGKSSEQAPAQRYLNFQRSRIRDARMVYGARFAAVLRVFLRAAYAGELAIEVAKWLLGHKRQLRAERMRVYWQVVRDL